MFQLTVMELDQLNRSQIVTSSQKHRNPKFGPHAFTKHGILVVSYFAVFLRAFAPLREPSCIKRQSHAKTPRRKDTQSQNKTLPEF